MIVIVAIACCHRRDHRQCRLSRHVYGNRTLTVVTCRECRHLLRKQKPHSGQFGAADRHYCDRHYCPLVFTGGYELVDVVVGTRRRRSKHDCCQQVVENRNGRRRRRRDVVVVGAGRS